jgi:glycosyltransferase involved in cell wall biosynthesis
VSFLGEDKYRVRREEGSSREGTSRPLVSVVMAVRDGEATVEESALSIQRQSLRSLELLIVDDGSTDGTLQLIHRLRDSDPRIRLLTSPRLGPAGARNAAIEMARGSYIAILDADDVATPDRLAKQVAALEGEPLLAAVASDAYHFVRPGVAVGVRSGAPRRKEELDWMKSRAANIVWSNSTMCWRRESLDALLGFDTRFPTAEDAELMNRAVYLHGMLILGLPEKLVWIRMSRASLSTSGLRQQRMLARYLELRNRCWIQGAPVPDVNSFLDRRPSPRESVRWTRHDVAAALYREAGFRVASGQRRGVISRILLSALLHPRYVARKVWSQRVRAKERG